MLGMPRLLLPDTPWCCAAVLCVLCRLRAERWPGLRLLLFPLWQATGGAGWLQSSFQFAGGEIKALPFW